MGKDVLLAVREAKRLKMRRRELIDIGADLGLTKKDLAYIYRNWSKIKTHRKW